MVKSVLNFSLLSRFTYRKNSMSLALTLLPFIWVMVGKVIQMLSGCARI